MPRSGSGKSKTNIATMVTVLTIAGILFGMYTYYNDRKPIIDLYPVTIDGNIPDLRFDDGEGEVRFVTRNIGKDSAPLTLTVTSEGAQIRTDTSEFSNSATYSYLIAYNPELAFQEMTFFIKPDPNVDKTTLKVDREVGGLLKELRYFFDKDLLVFERSTDWFNPNTFHYNSTASS